MEISKLIRKKLEGVRVAVGVEKSNSNTYHPEIEKVEISIKINLCRFFTNFQVQECKLQN